MSTVLCVNNWAIPDELKFTIADSVVGKLCYGIHSLLQAQTLRYRHVEIPSRDSYNGEGGTRAASAICQKIFGTEDTALFRHGTAGYVPWLFTERSRREAIALTHIAGTGPLAIAQHRAIRGSDAAGRVTLTVGTSEGEARWSVKTHANVVTTSAPSGSSTHLTVLINSAPEIIALAG